MRKSSDCETWKGVSEAQQSINAALLVLLFFRNHWSLQCLPAHGHINTAAYVVTLPSHVSIHTHAAALGGHVTSTGLSACEHSLFFQLPPQVSFQLTQMCERIWCLKKRHPQGRTQDTEKGQLRHCLILRRLNFYVHNFFVYMKMQEAPVMLIWKCSLLPKGSCGESNFQIVYTPEHETCIYYLAPVWIFLWESSVYHRSHHIAFERGKKRLT